MNEFRQAFRDFAESVGQAAEVPLGLRKEQERDVLVIPKQHKGGFEVELECMDYGVYPSSNGWHSGCWDVTVWSAEKLRESLAEFVDSVLHDAVMEVHYSNARPYKWTLHYNFEGERFSDTTGLFFYNWFGAKTVVKLSNVPSET